MQATVSRFDPVTRAGAVLLDDGAELPYNADAFDAARIRALRPGQRVRIEVAEAPVRRVTFLTIATLPDPPGRRRS